MKTSEIPHKYVYSAFPRTLKNPLGSPRDRSKTLCRNLHDPPGTPQVLTKSPRGPPRTLPRVVEDPPRTLQGLPWIPQDPPKDSPRSSQEPPGPPRTLQDPPGGAQDPPNPKQTFRCSIWPLSQENLEQIENSKGCSLGGGSAPPRPPPFRTACKCSSLSTWT